MNQGDIQEIIDNVNNNHQSNYLQIEALQKINEGGFQLLDLIITELKSHMTC